MKTKALLLPLSGLLLAVLNGCGVTVWNATRQHIAPNPNGIYTFTLAANLDKKRSVIDNSVRAQLIINGQTFIMNRSGGSPNLFTYDYPLPPSASEARYYYILEYDYEGNTTSTPKRHTTPIYHLKLTTPTITDTTLSEFIIPQETSTFYRLQSNRGPTGAIVSVSGQGLSAADRILIGGIQAETVFESEDTLTFRVPSLNAGRSYPIQLQNGYRSDVIGDFFVEPSPLRVTPHPVSLRSGQSQDLVFAIDFAAPRGGLLIDITTDIPSSIIMPEVVIPEGAREVTVNAQGGLPATGSLFITAAGFSEFATPVSVTP